MLAVHDFFVLVMFDLSKKFGEWNPVLGVLHHQENYDYKRK